MLFGNKSIGVEISASGISCVALSGERVSPRLIRVATSPFRDGTVKISLREPNILIPENFIETLKSAHNLLLVNQKRVSITLPDTVGRTLLFDMEGRFKSRTEALDMIRWKLKKSLPFDLSDTHLDYQQLAIRDNGDMALLVSLVSKRVIGQYEETVVAAGFTPSQIDCNGFNLYTIFESRLGQTDDVTVISFYDSVLNIMVFTNGLLEFQRIKDLPASTGVDSKVFMEITSSLISYRNRFPDRPTSMVTCIAHPEIASQFCRMVEEAVGSEPLLMEVKSAIIPCDDAPGDQKTLFPYSAAIGAAMRSL